MSRLAANGLLYPPVPVQLVGSIRGPDEAQIMANCRPIAKRIAARNQQRLRRTSRAREQVKTLLPYVLPLCTAFCWVTASGQNRRPAARRSSASASPPYGLRFPTGPSVNAELGTWEPGPLA